MSAVGLVLNENEPKRTRFPPCSMATDTVSRKKRLLPKKRLDKVFERFYNSK
jgi:hypothetical protein